MDNNPAGSTPNWLRYSLLAVVAVAGLGFGVLLLRNSAVPPPPPSALPHQGRPMPRAGTTGANNATARPAPTQAPTQTQAKAKPPVAPSFDVAAVSPEGSATFAGRATPGATIILRDGATVVGHTKANAQGQWVLLPGQPLTPGPHTLTLDQTLPNGTQLAGAAPVLITVPGQPGAAAPAAVLAAAGQPPRLLQTPTNTKLGLDALSYDHQGDQHFAGHAPPGATVRLYIDNHPEGTAQANAAGRWTLAPTDKLAPGTHELRLDEVNPAGKVVARVAQPFTRAPLEQARATDRTVVQPGQCLWILARKAYGAGAQYVVIFQANRDAIRNPNLIYPGQVFTIPPAAAAAR